MDIGGVTAEPMHARERPPERLARLFAGGWPAYIHADPVAAQHLPRVRELFDDLEMVLVDDSGELVAACWGAPIRWDGTTDDLPAGYSDSLARAVADHGGGAAANTLVIAAAQVHPGYTGIGLAGRVLGALSDAARRRGVAHVIAPLRPAYKAHYPLTTIEDYATWTRDDGLPLDPWLRTHRRMGATTIGTGPASQVFTGTAAEWEQWSGLALPASGHYIVPEALSPLRLDRGADCGTLTEPCIWVRHR